MLNGFHVGHNKRLTDDSFNLANRSDDAVKVSRRRGVLIEFEAKASQLKADYGTELETTGQWR
jgi:hypothetical protein